MAGDARRGRERTAREREVRELLAAGERGGLTLREMAEAAGMPAGTLAWWRSEIRRRDRLGASEAETAFLEVVVAQEPGDSTAAVGCDGVRPVGASDEELPPFELELRGGRRLRVPARFGLARLVREIEAC